MSLRDTGRRVRLRRTGRIPSDARVRHYDELSDDEQGVVRELAGEPWTAPEIGELDDGDVVKFTDYYLIRSR
ncbi:hypothetical protein EXE42_06515 [Halorubrum sp. SP3]|uniref:hypothetical protein n=1 Tax=unclassified Halorubrum TaxID=2642239 RepID=UPI0010F6427F|nr:MULTISPECIES: hypothetical protein [unclassified Halorubrum]TKX54762.1 hypothetical protein EXE42_06515 [Halorubrum sp. SP3]TKX69871.1 hypothetical protein EXE45_06665 [Halorubrum sp. SP9]